MVKRNATQRERSQPSALTCQQVTALIQTYLAGELDPAMTVALEKHVRNCPDCVAFINTYKQTIGAVRSLRYGDIPAEMQTRVVQFLRTKIRGPLPPR